jgi:hypothetical protein
MLHGHDDHAAATSRRGPLARLVWGAGTLTASARLPERWRPFGSAHAALHVTPCLLGAGAGALLAGVFALLLEQSLTDSMAAATIASSLVNCAAAGSLVARCIAR